MRRTTLGPISSSQLNARANSNTNINNDSKIPNGRISVGTMDHVTSKPPPQMRQSFGPAMRRVSIQKQQQQQQARGPRGSISRQSVSSRRSSVMRGSLLMSSRASGGINVNGNGGTSSMLRQDPRPISDKTYMNTCIHQLIQFLSDHQFDHVLSPKLLKGPTKKDFSNIISFLFRQIDPNIEFTGKFEEDVANLFKILKYPFAISKTALVAVGSPHTWPTLLASIAWIIELLNYDEEVQRTTNNGKQEAEEENGDKMFFDYLGVAYRTFLSGEDEKYHILEQELANQIHVKNTTLQHLNDELQQKIEQKRVYIEQVKQSQAILPNLQNKQKDLTSDLIKFQKLCTQLEQHHVLIGQKIEERMEEKNKKQEKYFCLQKTIDQIQFQLDQQQISFQEIEQIQCEKKRLMEQLRLIQQKKQHDIQPLIFQQETFLSNQMGVLEDLIQVKYFQKASDLKLIHPDMESTNTNNNSIDDDDEHHHYHHHSQHKKPPPKNALGFNYEIDLASLHHPSLPSHSHSHGNGSISTTTIPTTSSNGLHFAEELISILKKQIRPSLNFLKKNRLERMQIALDENAELQVLCDESCFQLQKETSLLQEKEQLLKKLQEFYQREKEQQHFLIEQKAKQSEEMELKIENFFYLQEKIEIQKKQFMTELMELNSLKQSRQEQYGIFLTQQRNLWTKILFTCTEHKEHMECNICHFEKELEQFWSKDTEDKN